MKRFTLFFVLLYILLLSGCSTQPTENNQEFEKLTNQLFIQQMNQDALTAKYTLAHPEKYGVSKHDATLGTISADLIRETLTQAENRLQCLKQFNEKDLSYPQQTLYQTMVLSLTHEMQEKDFIYHHIYLTPTTGIQAQLPIILSEYRFQSKNDIEDYFHLLKSIPAYFQSLADYEESKTLHHLASTSATLTRVISQCREFCANPQNNLLISTFKERIQELPFLSENDRKTYLAQNSKIVNESVLPAYKNLILSLSSLLSQSRLEGSLSQLKNGKSYYRHLFQTSVGSTRSIESAKSLLQNHLQNSRKTLSELAVKNPQIFKKAAITSRSTGAPNQILAKLKKACKKDFPAISDVRTQIKYVPASLENFLSPAFYLTPPIDQNSTHQIYINGSTKFENTNLFPTLAHEGYPGHLFQTAYLQEHQVSPYCSLIDVPGYTEGWATYAEIFSYDYAGLEKDVKTVLIQSTISSLCLYTLCDIGVHYEGWDLTQTGKFLEKNGVQEIRDVISIYQNIIDEPCTYPAYAMGYLELIECQNTVKKLLGNKFSNRSFHQWILQSGPCWYDVLNAHTDACRP